MNGGRRRGIEGLEADQFPCRWSMWILLNWWHITHAHGLSCGPSSSCTMTSASNMLNVHIPLEPMAKKRITIEEVVTNSIIGGPADITCVGRRCCVGKLITLTIYSKERISGDIKISVSGCRYGLMMTDFAVWRLTSNVLLASIGFVPKDGILENIGDQFLAKNCLYDRGS